MSETLVNLLANSVSHFADAEAVVHAGRRVSYRQLWQQVQAVAVFLQQNGLQKGDRVALLLGNSVEYIAAYYGTLAAGGVVVALNAAVKARDINNWIKHSEAGFLIVDASHTELKRVLEECRDNLCVLCVNYKGTQLPAVVHSWEQLSADVTTNISTDLDSSDLAAIIYTSGTTGHPKGVMLTHGNFVSNIRSILEYLKLSEKDSIVNILPFYYSYGNSVLHTHMAVGARLILENSMMYPHKVIEILANEKASGFSGVPSTFALLLSRVKLSDYDLTSLRYLTQAGGPMPPAHIQRLHTELPNTELIIMYGQTEATARIAYLPAERLDEKLGSAGIAIPNVEVEVRDEQGNAVSGKTVGEIYVRGDNLMPGYWKNPEMTQEVLINGWLKTGDLAYMDDEGYIFIQGRNSDMIKTGANRISPTEIEEVIQELENVVEVAAVGVADEILGEAIKVFIVKRKDKQLDQKYVQQYCRKNLARYKIPKYIKFIDELPKTASGKVRRYLLAQSENKRKNNVN